MEFNDILKLAKTVAKADPSKPVAYSFGEKSFGYSEMNETLRAEFAALAPDYRTYKINQNTIFALIEQTIDDVLPNRVMEQYGQFAEIKTFNRVISQSLLRRLHRLLEIVLNSSSVKLDLLVFMKYSNLMDVATK